MVGKLVTGLILFMKVAMIRTAQVDFALNDSDIDNVGLSRCILLDYNIFVSVLITMQLIVSGTIGRLGRALLHAEME